VKYQINRAVAAVHGPEAVTEELTADTPLDAAFVEGVETGECSVAASVRRGSDIRAKTAAVTVAILALLYALVEVVWMRRYGPEAEITKTRWFAILFFTVPQLMLLSAAILEIKMIGDAWAMTLVPLILIRKAVEAFPVSVGVMWVFALLIAIVSYLIVQSRYAKAEAPVPREGSHLLSEY
jgi:hypothetical protein